MNKLLIITGPEKSGKEFVTEQMKSAYYNIESCKDADLDYRNKLIDRLSVSIGTIRTLTLLSREQLPSISLTGSYPYWLIQDVIYNKNRSLSSLEVSEEELLNSIEKSLIETYDVKMIILLPSKEYMLSSGLTHVDKQHDSYMTLFNKTNMHNTLLCASQLVPHNVNMMRSIYQWLNSDHGKKMI